MEQNQVCQTPHACTQELQWGILKLRTLLHAAAYMCLHSSHIWPSIYKSLLNFGKYDNTTCLNRINKYTFSGHYTVRKGQSPYSGQQQEIQTILKNYGWLLATLRLWSQWRVRIYTGPYTLLLVNNIISKTLGCTGQIFAVGMGLGWTPKFTTTKYDTKKPETAILEKWVPYSQRYLVLGLVGLGLPLL